MVRKLKKTLRHDSEKNVFYSQYGLKAPETEVACRDLNLKIQFEMHMSRNSKQMPSDVADALQEIFIKEGRLSKEQAQDYLTQLIRTKRYQRETWA